MVFDWNELYNPIFGWKCSVRDPAAIYHDGWFYLYFTVQFEQDRWSCPEGFQSFWIKTRDFRKFTYPEAFTPRGFVSPGNVIRANGRWYMSITRYPHPCALAITESDDLEHWSEPRIILPNRHGSYWGNVEHGPIDGYLFCWQNRYWVLHTDYQAGTHAQHLGLLVSDDLEHFENLTEDHPLLDSDYYNSQRGIENASLVIDGDTLHLFCSVGMPEQHVAVLSSKDIFSWPKLDKSAEISGLRQNWSAFIACAQFVADWRNETGFWTMLFMGTRHQDPYDRMMLGMARSKDLKNWEVLPEGPSEEEYLANIEKFRLRCQRGELD